MKIGFSLSFCIRDIAEGRVKIEDVYHIVTGCSPTNEAEVQGILDQYAKVYWRNCADKAKDIFLRLRHEHKIMWCSDFQKNPVMIGSVLWIDWPGDKPGM